MLHKPASPFRGFWYYLRCKSQKRPLLVNLEFTKRCNARCGFCTSWQLESGKELSDYGPVIKKFRPVLCSVSGGEPLLRKNYAELLRGIRPYCHYLAIISNGALLNEESAKKLIDAGVDQICVSLDYMGKRHDEARKIEGLYDHVSKMIPKLAKAGFRIALNTVIMESNLDDVLPITYRAAEWGAMISFSAYCPLKNDNDDGMVRQERYSQLVGILKEIRRLKGALGHIKNSDYYLKKIPAYFRDGRMDGCRAGYKWLQVTPDGYIQQCSELPRVCSYEEFSREKISPATCAKCWYTCRGESEAPQLTPKRVLELIRA
jgi:MoaA/NifB/PqqE/SkfB family radical SAM enzyme